MRGANSGGGGGGGGAADDDAAANNGDGESDADAAARERREAREAELEAARKLAAALPRPDLDVMEPFVPLEDPDAGAGAGHALGALLPPLRGILERLPPAREYDGAVVAPHIIMHLLRHAQLPPHARLDRLAPFVPAAARADALGTRKRKAVAGAAAAAAVAGTLSGTGTAAATPTDIFRLRRTKQQKK